jgi:uncharacterized protein (DUF2252 family)
MSEKRAAIPPSGRQKALADEQHRKMAASAHAYVRGSTVRFYQWLEASDRCVLPEGPGVWRAFRTRRFFSTPV